MQIEFSVAYRMTWCTNSGNGEYYVNNCEIKSLYAKTSRMHASMVTLGCRVFWLVANLHRLYKCPEMASKKSILCIHSIRKPMPLWSDYYVSAVESVLNCMGITLLSPRRITQRKTNYDIKMKCGSSLFLSSEYCCFCCLLWKWEYTRTLLVIKHWCD